TAPAGVIATRFSLFLISVGIPIRMISSPLSYEMTPESFFKALSTLLYFNIISQYLTKNNTVF
ncbi:hypothetical protein ACT453_60260, partial [Bacillus sp. D-CC]